LQTIPTINQTKVKAELCKRDFFFFVQEFWSVIIPEEPMYNWHIEYLCKELQQIVERVANREDKLYDLVINIPPGTSKSTIVTVMLPAWSWTIDPRIRNLTASYSASLSTDHAIKSRDIIKSDKYISYFPNLTIKRDQDNKTHYKNDFGGERYATSVTGTVTGFHAHLIIVDDPLNPKGASSEADRTTANNFMDVTLSTRKVSKSVTPTILVMQRLHQKDCTGNWLEKEGKILKHICLPGEISKDVKPIELRDKYVNGLLDIQRLKRNDLKELRVNLGSYGYAGQIMQIPSPLDGGIWQKWIKPIQDSELNKIVPNLQSFGSDWDLAYTEKQTNSASAFVSAGKYDNNMYITDLGFEWLEFPKLMSYMKSKSSPHYIEAKASGKSAKQTLTNQGIPAIEVNVTGGDKEARANMVTPYAESGVIYCRASLLDKLYYDSKQGILVFPNGDGDDLQDALVQSIGRLLGNPQVFFF
jgi:predicted phage terminase large subunit-like protein